MDESTNTVPARCVCWMLRTLPVPAICREFRAHPELTIQNRAECADCTHPEVCHLNMLGEEDELLPIE